MDFRQSVANDTTSVFQNVLKRRSELTRDGLDALRKGLNDAVSALDSALSPGADNKADQEISALVERLASTMTTQSQAAADRVRAEAEQKLAVVEGNRAQAESQLAESAKAHDKTQQKLGDAKAKTEALVATLDEQHRKHEALAISARDLQRKLDALQEEFERERKQADSLSGDLERAKNARAAAETAAQEAEAARRQHEHARKALQRELLDVRAALDKSRAESTVLNNRLTAAAAERAALDAALVEARDRMENTRRELQVKLDATAEREAVQRERLVGAEVAASEARAEAASIARQLGASQPATRDRHVDQSAAPDFIRLIAAYQEIEAGRSIAAVLTALTKGLSDQFARVALFNVSGNALQGSYQLGFDIDITKIIIPLTMESVLTRALESGTIETAASDDPPNRVGVPFGSASGWCLGLPVVLKGETIAVIYADHGEEAGAATELESSRIAYADLLRRHTAAVLVKLSVDLKAWSELRDYAMLLLDEIEYIYGADVTSGKANPELVQRLADNLRCAEAAYRRRVESLAPSEEGVDLFEGRLNTLLDAKGATPFGRHLAAAAAELAIDKSSDSSASHRTAQAS